MPIDGYVHCKKCNHALQIQNLSPGQFKSAIAQFIASHFEHGELAVMRKDFYQRYLIKYNHILGDPKFFIVEQGLGDDVESVLK